MLAAIRAVALVVLSALAASQVNCGTADDLCSGASSDTQAVVGGVARSPYVGLAWQGSLVPLVDADGSELCSSAAVSDSLLLTAAHCLDRLSAAIPWGTAVTPELVHVDPDNDFAILRVSADPPLRPVRLGRDVAALAGPGSLVEIGGFGQSETAPALTPHFAILSVDRLSDAEVTTYADGYAGGCFGDSGSPLLTRDDDGAPVMVAMLRSGSASCRDRDRSLRADVVRDLMPGAIALAAVPGGDCSHLPTQGRCYGDVAVTCQDGVVRGTRCAADLSCGWNPATAGYGCIPRATDPCQGVSELGDCAGTTARSCARGTLSTSPCGACRAACVRSPWTGLAACAPS